MNTYNTNNSGIDFNPIIKAALLAAIVIIALSSAYYNFIFMPSIEKEKLALQQIQEAEGSAKTQSNEKKLKECIDQANQYFKDSWDKWCANYGIDHMNNDCGLPETQSDRIHKIRKQDHETCIKLYKNISN